MNLHRQSADGERNLTLCWQNVTVHPKKQAKKNRDCNEPLKKCLLNNVSGIARPGELVALMGASGAGKTTLFNVLTERADDLLVEGKISVNGQPLGKGIAAVSAYIEQHDIFTGLFTVYEHLSFHAALKMTGTNRAERHKRVTEVLHEMGLTECTNTTIGVPGETKTISGGEMKRLSLAAELLTNPALLFADEPTTGLDSFMALTVVQTLKKMSAQGKTVICVMHQPASPLIQMFDKLLLLSEGKVAYFGSAVTVTSYFASLGYPCPENYNPADFIIRLIAIEPGKEKISRAKVAHICDTADQSDLKQQLDRDIEEENHTGCLNQSDAKLLRKKAKEYRVGYLMQYKQLLWRNAVAIYRDTAVVGAFYLENLILAVLYTAIFAGQNAPYNQLNVQNINGAIFEIIAGHMLFTYVFLVLGTFPLEFPVLRREKSNHMYATWVYFGSRGLVEIPMVIAYPIVTFIGSYWTIGFIDTPEAAGLFIGASISYAFVSIALGYFLSTLSDNLTVVLSLGAPILSPLVAMSGFVFNVGSMPVWAAWTKYISPPFYIMELLISNQWMTVDKIDCVVSGVVINETAGSCYRNGREVLSSLSYNSDNVMFDLIMINVLAFVMRSVVNILLDRRLRS